MAQKQPSTWRKVLNFIGFSTEEEEPREEKSRNYGSGSYGRQDSYEPPQQRKSREGRGDAERYSRSDADRNVRTDGSSSRYGDSSQNRRRNDAVRPEERTGRSYRERENDGRAPSRDKSYADTRFEADRTSDRFAQEQRNPRKGTANAEQEQCAMFSLVELKDCCEVINRLLQNNTVVLTMNKMDDKTAERSVDTLSGAVYALDANMNKISDMTYLITPKNVVVNGSEGVRRN